MSKDELVSDDPNPHGPWQEFEMSSGAVVYVGSPDSHILFLLRGDGLLTLPKGHVEQGERGDHAALRELQEETGISSRDVKREGFLGYFTNPIILPDDTRILKVVSYYLFKSSSKYLTETRISAAHRAYVWLDLHQVGSARFAYAHIRDAILAASDQINRPGEVSR